MPTFKENSSLKINPQSSDTQNSIIPLRYSIKEKFYLPEDSELPEDSKIPEEQQPVKWVDPDTWEGGPFINWKNHRRRFAKAYFNEVVKVSKLSTAIDNVDKKKSLQELLDDEFLNLLKQIPELQIIRNNLQNIAKRYKPSSVRVNSGAEKTKLIIEKYHEKVIAAIKRSTLNGDALVEEIVNKLIEEFNKAFKENSYQVEVTHKQYWLVMGLIKNLDKNKKEKQIKKINDNINLNKYFFDQLRVNKSEYLCESSKKVYYVVNHKKFNNLVEFCCQYAKNDEKEAIEYFAKLLNGEIKFEPKNSEAEKKFKEWLKPKGKNKKASTIFSKQTKNSEYYKLATAVEKITNNNNPQKWLKDLYIHNGILCWQIAPYKNLAKIFQEKDFDTWFSNAIEELFTTLFENFPEIANNEQIENIKTSLTGAENQIEFTQKFWESLTEQLQKNTKDNNQFDHFYQFITQKGTVWAKAKALQIKIEKSLDESNYKEFAQWFKEVDSYLEDNNAINELYSSQQAKKSAEQLRAEYLIAMKEWLINYLQKQENNQDLSARARASRVKNLALYAEECFFKTEDEKFQDNVRNLAIQQLVYLDDIEATEDYMSALKQKPQQEKILKNEEMQKQLSDYLIKQSTASSLLPWNSSAQLVAQSLDLCGTGQQLANWLIAILRDPTLYAELASNPLTKELQKTNLKKIIEFVKKNKDGIINFEDFENLFRDNSETTENHKLVLFALEQFFYNSNYLIQDENYPSTELRGLFEITFKGIKNIEITPDNYKKYEYTRTLKNLENDIEAYEKIFRAINSLEKFLQDNDEETFSEDIKKILTSFTDKLNVEENELDVEKIKLIISELDALLVFQIRLEQAIGRLLREKKNCLSVAGSLEGFVKSCKKLQDLLKKKIEKDETPNKKNQVLQKENELKELQKKFFNGKKKNDNLKKDIEALNKEIQECVAAKIALKKIDRLGRCPSLFKQEEISLENTYNSLNQELDGLLQSKEPLSKLFINCDALATCILIFGLTAEQKLELQKKIKEVIDKDKQQSPLTETLNQLHRALEPLPQNLSSLNSATVEAIDIIQRSHLLHQLRSMIFQLKNDYINANIRRSSSSQKNLEASLNATQKYKQQRKELKDFIEKNKEKFTNLDKLIFPEHMDFWQFLIDDLLELEPDVEITKLIDAILKNSDAQESFGKLVEEERKIKNTVKEQVNKICEKVIRKKNKKADRKEKLSLCFFLYEQAIDCGKDKNPCYYERLDISSRAVYHEELENVFEDFFSELGEIHCQRSEQSKGVNDIIQSFTPEEYEDYFKNLATLYEKEKDFLPDTEEKLQRYIEEAAWALPKELHSQSEALHASSSQLGINNFVVSRYLIIKYFAHKNQRNGIKQIIGWLRFIYQQTVGYSNSELPPLNFELHERLFRHAIDAEQENFEEEIEWLNDLIAKQQESQKTRSHTKRLEEFQNFCLKEIMDVRLEHRVQIELFDLKLQIDAFLCKKNVMLIQEIKKEICFECDIIAIDSLIKDKSILLVDGKLRIMQANGAEKLITLYNDIKNPWVNEFFELLKLRMQFNQAESAESICILIEANKDLIDEKYRNRAASLKEFSKAITNLQSADHTYKQKEILIQHLLKQKQFKNAKDILLELIVASGLQTNYTITPDFKTKLTNYLDYLNPIGNMECFKSLEESQFFVCLEKNDKEKAKELQYRLNAKIFLASIHGYVDELTKLKSDKTAIQKILCPTSGYLFLNLEDLQDLVQKIDTTENEFLWTTFVLGPIKNVLETCKDSEKFVLPEETIQFFQNNQDYNKISFYKKRQKEVDAFKKSCSSGNQDFNFYIRILKFLKQMRSEQSFADTCKLIDEKTRNEFLSHFEWMWSKLCDSDYDGTYFKQHRQRITQDLSLFEEVDLIHEAYVVLADEKTNKEIEKQFKKIVEKKFKFVQENFAKQLPEVKKIDNVFTFQGQIVENEDYHGLMENIELTSRLDSSFNNELFNYLDDLKVEINGEQKTLYDYILIIFDSFSRDIIRYLLAKDFAFGNFKGLAGNLLNLGKSDKAWDDSQFNTVKKSLAEKLEIQDFEDFESAPVDKSTYSYYESLTNSKNKNALIMLARLKIGLEELSSTAFSGNDSGKRKNIILLNLLRINRLIYNHQTSNVKDKYQDELLNKYHLLINILCKFAEHESDLVKRKTSETFQTTKTAIVENEVERLMGDLQKKLRDLRSLEKNSIDKTILCIVKLCVDYRLILSESSFSILRRASEQVCANSLQEINFSKELKSAYDKGFKRAPCLAIFMVGYVEDYCNGIDKATATICNLINFMRDYQYEDFPSIDIIIKLIKDKILIDGNEEIEKTLREKLKNFDNGVRFIENIPNKNPLKKKLALSEAQHIEEEQPQKAPHELSRNSSSLFSLSLSRESPNSEKIMEEYQGNENATYETLEDFISSSKFQP